MLGPVARVDPRCYKSPLLLCLDTLMDTPLSLTTRVALLSGVFTVLLDRFALAVTVTYLAHMIMLAWAVKRGFPNVTRSRARRCGSIWYAR